MQISGVYEVPCSCDKSYIRQTGKTIEVGTNKRT